MTQLFIDVGVDVSAADMYGSTPLHIALSNGHEAVAQLLRNRGTIRAPLVAVHAPTASA